MVIYMHILDVKFFYNFKFYLMTMRLCINDAPSGIILLYIENSVL